MITEAEIKYLEEHFDLTPDDDRPGWWRWETVNQVQIWFTYMWPSGEKEGYPLPDDVVAFYCPKTTAAYYYPYAWLTQEGAKEHLIEIFLPEIEKLN